MPQSYPVLCKLNKALDSHIFVPAYLYHAALNCAMMKMNMAERVLPDYHRKGITLLIHTRKVPTAICKGIIAGEGINNTLLYVIPFYLIHTKTLNVFIQEIIKVI